MKTSIDEATFERRQFLAGAAALGGGAVLAACTVTAPSYAYAADQTWQPFNERERYGANLRNELIRYATLAPSSHNTQCWRFASDPLGVTIHPDFSRRCPAVDPDGHHLFVSLGCATENLVLAAAAHALHGEVTFDPSGGGAVRVDLLPASSVHAPVSYDAIPLRQCSRDAYDGRPLARAELQALANAGSGPGIDVMLLTEQAHKERVLDFVVEGNTTQMDDPAFMRELATWIRFSDAEAVEMRPQFGAALGLGNRRPDLVVRFGRGPAMPRSLRRPVSAVLV